MANVYTVQERYSYKVNACNFKEMASELLVIGNMVGYIIYLDVFICDTLIPFYLAILQDWYGLTSIYCTLP